MPALNLRASKRAPTCCPNGYECHIPHDDSLPVTCERYQPVRSEEEKETIRQKLREMRKHVRKQVHDGMAKTLALWRNAQRQESEAALKKAEQATQQYSIEALLNWKPTQYANSRAAQLLDEASSAGDDSLNTDGSD